MWIFVISCTYYCQYHRIESLTGDLTWDILGHSSHVNSETGNIDSHGIRY